MHTVAYLLILLSALVHATWNVLAKHVKGNTPALVFAHLFGSFLVFPFIYLEDNPWVSLHDQGAQLLLIGSVTSHAAYTVLISSAYVYGDVGLVYPLARGSPIVFAAIGLEVLGVEGRPSTVAIVGMVIVVSGIVFLGTEAFHESKNDDSIVDDDVLNPIPTLTDNEDDMNVEEVSSPEGIEMTLTNESCGDDFNHSNLVMDDVQSVCSLASSILTDRKKVINSIILALAVGVSSASYSSFDALSVSLIPPILLLFLMDFFSSLVLLPYLYGFHYNNTILALKEHKLSIMIIAPCLVGSYLIILIVFSMYDVGVAIVVSVRTSSVLLGSIIGVMFLGERFSFFKFFSIFVIFVGIVTIKFS